MRRRGGPNVAIAFGPGGPLTAQLRAVESPGGTVESVTHSAWLFGSYNLIVETSHESPSSSQCISY